MAQHSSVGHGIEDVYNSVINDVISQVKEAFLDENVDIDVLQQIKEAWQYKVTASGAVDTTGARGLPPMRQPTVQHPYSEEYKYNSSQPQQSGAPKNWKIDQLDGGPGMSDSSSEDEGDDAPLERFADMGGEVIDDAEGGEEEPLNSNDDQSDDEDLGTLFDAENVVVCQFEKVHRARSKWKFVLKDGIMHLNGKDYVFQKCTGEAEW